MNEQNPQIINNNPNINEFLFCPSKKCLYCPEISYLYNPFKYELQYKCKCNNEQPINIKLREFLQKCSNIVCQKCKKTIKEENFFYCLNCKNILDIYCANNHDDKTKPPNSFKLNKNNMFNYCVKDKLKYILRCIDCNQSLCGKCDINFHGEHTLEQFKKLAISENNLLNIKSIFEKQQNILKMIKIIIYNLINNFENDIKIKKLIINNYINNKNDYNSIINLQNLYMKNQEKYENILSNFLKPNDSHEKNAKIQTKYEKFIDIMFLPFYYSLMINKDENVNMELINTMKRKINSLFENIQNNQDINVKSDISVRQNNIKTENNNFNLYNRNINTNNINFPLISNNLNIYNPYERLITNTNENIENNIFFSKNFDKNPSLQYNIDYLNSNIDIIKPNNINNFGNTLLPHPQNTFKEYFIDTKDKSKETKEIKKNNDSSTNLNNKGNTKFEEKEKAELEQNNNLVNNMILLKSGNIAISIKTRIDIYDFRKLNISDQNKIINNEDIKKSNCLLQNIYPSNNLKDKYISYIYEYPKGQLLCSLFSEIIRIRLTNQDRNHVKLGRIILDNFELTKKIISLGNSLLVILSEKNKDCYIRIYNKIEDSQIMIKNNIDMINNIISGYLFEKTEFNNNINNDNVNIIDNNKTEDLNRDITHKENIKEDKTFEIIEKNINDLKISWVNIFSIKKRLGEKNQPNNYRIEDNNCNFEFISTSNANYKFGLGKDKIIFYSIRKESFNKYYIRKIGVIDGISCSIGTNSICQLNEKYLCVGFNNCNHSGFVIIDINKRQKYKMIESGNVTCLYYDKENDLLIKSIQKLFDKNIQYITKIYKVNINSKDGQNDEIKFDKKYEYLNSQNSLITSIQKINLDSKKNYVFITYSKDFELEIIQKEINELNS